LAFSFDHPPDLSCILQIFSLFQEKLELTDDVRVFLLLVVDSSQVQGSVRLFLDKELVLLDRLGICGLCFKCSGLQPVSEAREYLDRLGVVIADVRQQSISSIPVHGTPTLLLVNRKGKLLKNGSD